MVVFAKLSYFTACEGKVDLVISAGNNRCLLRHNQASEKRYARWQFLIGINDRHPVFADDGAIVLLKRCESESAVRLNIAPGRLSGMHAIALCDRREHHFALKK